MRSWPKPFIPLVAMWLLMGCGYHLVGKETHLPPEIRSLAIPLFANKTFEPGIEVPFTQGFLREFIQDRRMRVTAREEADSILEGVIKAFQISSSSYDRSGVAQEYQVTVVLDLTLRMKNGEVLWVEKDLSDSRFYRASANVLLTESNKAAAIQSLARWMAGRVRHRFFSHF